MKKHLWVSIFYLLSFHDFSNYWDDSLFLGRGNRKRKESAPLEETMSPRKKSENLSDGTWNTLSYSLYYV